MRNSLKGALKALILGGLAVALWAGAPLILPSLLAWGAYRLVNRIPDRADAQAGQAAGVAPEDQKRLQKGVSLGREEALRNKRGGWRLSGVPLDMKLERQDGVVLHSATFEAAGIKGLVKARHNVFSDRASYSFGVDDLDMALKVQDYVRENHLDARVNRRGDDGYEVSCSDIMTVDTLAKLAYPKKSVSVDREVTLVQQYVVVGVASYAEALEKFKADRSCGRFVNSYVMNTDYVDGETKGVVSKNGKPLGLDYNEGRLHVGSYIIDEKEITRLSGTLEVPAFYDTVPSSALKQFGTRTPGVSVSSEKEYTDGTPEGMKRYFVPKNGFCATFKDSHDPSVVVSDGLYANVVFDSVGQMMSVVRDGVLDSGSEVIVSREPLSLANGKYVLSIPLSTDVVRESICLQEALPEHVAELAQKLSLDERDVEYSRIAAEASASRNGRAMCELRQPVRMDTLAVGFSEINGVDLDVVRDLLSSSGKIPDLSEEMVSQWLKESTEIRSVSMKLDPERSVLFIRSAVGDTKMKTEEISLTPEQMMSFIARGGVEELSVAEMKDVLMRLHPGYFKVYSDGKGQSVFADPLGDFLSGRKPVMRDGQGDKARLSAADNVKENTQEKKSGKRTRTVRGKKIS